MDERNVLFRVLWWSRLTNDPPRLYAPWRVNIFCTIAIRNATIKDATEEALRSAFPVNTISSTSEYGTPFFLSEFPAQNLNFSILMKKKKMGGRILLETRGCEED